VEDKQYLFVVYSIFVAGIVIFSFLINTIMLKFETTLGIRNNDQPVVRWSNVAKPALGGITIYISFLLSSTCFSIFFDDVHVFNDMTTLGLLTASSIAFLMGLADDAYNTRPYLKFTVQILCGVIVCATGSSIQLFEADLLNYTLTVLWVIGIMNSINMLDNMDGITTTISIFILLACLSNMVIHDNYHFFDFIAILGVLASLLAFLFHNWYPSKMFMGDTGSQFLGVFLAIMSIRYLWNSTNYSGEVIHSQQISTLLIAFALPIIDTTSVVINRLARKQSPFVGGKDHTTHHLSYLGFSDGRVGFIYLTISAFGLLFVIGSLRFIDKWDWKFTTLYTSFFVLLFVIFFYITQKNKDKRK